MAVGPVDRRDDSGTAVAQSSAVRRASNLDVEDARDLAEVEQDAAELEVRVAGDEQVRHPETLYDGQDRPVGFSLRIVATAVSDWRGCAASTAENRAIARRPSTCRPRSSAAG